MQLGFQYPPDNTPWRLAFCLCLFLQLSSTPASANTHQLFNLTEIAKGIYVHQGKHVGFADPGHDDVANIGFIVGDECVAVIDTGGSVYIARALLSAIRKITQRRICYVINTHIHFDHLLGNSVFRKDKVKFVGHYNLANEIAANRAFFLKQFRQELGDNPNENSIVAPDVLVDKHKQIDLGNRILLLTAYTSAHSHTDLTVFDERTQTLWLSDLLFMERIPAVSGSMKEWLKITNSLEEISAQRLVPGHGPSSTNPLVAFDAMQQYFEIILTQTRRRISTGQLMEDIIASVGEQEKRHWLLHRQHHKRNVTKAFSELEWE